MREHLQLQLQGGIPGKPCVGVRLLYAEWGSGLCFVSELALHAAPAS